MIQRIQTVYLIAAFVLMLFPSVFPAAQLLAAGGYLYELKLTGVFEVQGNAVQLLILYWPLVILLSVILIIHATAIILYRNRKLQMRLCIYNILLQAGLTGLMVFYLTRTFRETGAMEYSYKLPVVFPILAMILTYLAFRSVRKDELLVQAADRIR